MQISGIAHVQLAVINFEACSAFYEKLFSFFEMTEVPNDEGVRYWIGGKTGIAISRASENSPFNEDRAGLHHFCFRLKSKEDVDQLHLFLTSISATIIRKPYEGPWAPGYYSVLFEDPDGITLEANFVPGKGLLNK